MPTFAIAFTGHRPNRLPTDPERLEELKLAINSELELLAERGYDTLYCGMAEGADLLCFDTAWCLGPLAEPWQQMRIFCVLPYEQHYLARSSLNREGAYYDLLRADGIISMAPSYQPGCFHKRNRYMVDHCDLLLAVYDGVSSGGTAYTVKYACKQNKPIIIHPHTLERTFINHQD